jgi:hypothetical protein
MTQLTGGSLNFNASDYQPRAEVGAVPAGKYLCIAEDTERKNTKNEEAQYLQITWQIIEGEYKGRKIFERLNLWKAQGGDWVRRTDDAGTIAGQTMSGILMALGIATIRNHEELRGKKAFLKVKVRKSEEYGDSNDVQNHYPASGATPAAAPVSAPPAAPTGNGGGAPWA